mgnify:CR=1 FL=1
MDKQISPLNYLNEEESTNCLFKNFDPKSLNMIENSENLDEKEKKLAVAKVYDEGIYQVPVMPGSWVSVDRAELKFLEFYNNPLKFFPHKNYTVTTKLTK